MGIDYRKIESEVLAGLKHETERLDEAKMSLNFFNGDFKPYRKCSSDELINESLIREIWLTNFVVNKLSENLYRHDPIRELKRHAEANTWIQSVYKSCSMLGKWHAADQLSILTGVAALQPVPTDNPKEPIKVHIWDGSQLVVYANSDDPTEAEAVVTIARHDCRSRFTVWTEEMIGVYETDKYEQGCTAGNRIPKLVRIDPNPYKTLPFTFVHYTLPTSNFWVGCPGPILAQLNLWLNDRLSKMAEAAEVYLKPPIVGSGVSPTWSPGKYGPGDILIPDPDNATMNDSAAKAELKLLEYDQSTLTTAWEDIKEMVNHTFDTMGVPGSAFRMNQGSARSGESIKSEQIPLLQYTAGRKPIFAHYEAHFARKVLEVAVAYPPPGIPKEALQAALQDFDFSLRWGEAYSELPGPERDREDLFNLQLGLTDPVEILQRRQGFTQDEAMQHLRNLAARKEELTRLLGDRDFSQVNTTAETITNTAPVEAQKNQDTNQGTQ